MNANNQQPSFKTHWVNTKTIADVIAALDSCKGIVSCLYENAKGHDRLREQLLKAYYNMSDARFHMSESQVVNKIDYEEE